ncbi:hypothetical protein B0H14DRAFT_3487386 [Mycena olivaceomarginata]|nr:hypothetical protein B0H14DRAFT_3487386 [Mycena olivaceomarginata]
MSTNPRPEPAANACPKIWPLLIGYDMNFCLKRRGGPLDITQSPSPSLDVDCDYDDMPALLEIIETPEGQLHDTSIYPRPSRSHHRTHANAHAPPRSALEMASVEEESFLSEVSPALQQEEGVADSGAVELIQ